MGRQTLSPALRPLALLAALLGAPLTAQAAEESCPLAWATAYSKLPPNASLIEREIAQAFDDGEDLYPDNLRRLVDYAGGDKERASVLYKRQEELFGTLGRLRRLSKEDFSVLEALRGPAGLGAPVAQVPVNAAAGISRTHPFSFPIKVSSAPEAVRTQALPSSQLDAFLETGFQSRARGSGVPELAKLEDRIAADENLAHSLMLAQKQGFSVTRDLATPFVEASQSPEFLRRAFENNPDLAGRPMLVVRFGTEGGYPTIGNLADVDQEAGVMFLGGVAPERFRKVYHRNEAGRWFRLERSAEGVWLRVPASRAEVEGVGAGL
jgi:hypothetical protein